MTPPRLAERWLRALIPDPHSRRMVVHDLREDHARLARRFTTPVAHLWYWMAAAATAAWYVRERLGPKRVARKSISHSRGKGDAVIHTLWYDLRLAARAVRRAPAFSAVAIITIALGVGATTTIFAVLDNVVLKPLPYVDADRVVSIGTTAPGNNIDRMGVTNSHYFHFGENASTLADLALYIEQSLPSEGEAGAIELGVIYATPELFSVLRVAPLLGRLYTAEDARPGADPVVLITHRFWTSRFGGDSSIVGQPFSDDSPAPIVGVLPDWFDFIRPKASATFGNAFNAPDIVVPLTLRRSTARFGNHMYQAVGRLAPGVTLEEARTELAGLTHEMPELYPGGITARMAEEGGHKPLVKPLRDALVGDMARVLWILMGAVGLVLLIATINVVNLFIVRAETRRREIAVRQALGASGGQLSRGFLAEALLLGLGGGVAGVLVTALGTSVLIRLAPREIPRLDQVGVDIRVLAFAATISLVATLVLGLVPWARFRNSNVAPVLGDESRGATSGRQSQRARHTLVVAQVALALVLLVGSGLLVRTFWNLRNVRPGFGATNALTVRITLGNSFEGPEGRTQFLLELTERLERHGGVERAAFAGDLPLDGTVYSAEFAIEGWVPEPGAQAPNGKRNFIGPGYLRAIGAKLLQGRELERQDYATSVDVAVVNRTFAEERWPDENPIGKRLVQWPAEPGTWYRVVGVVADIREASLAEEPLPMVYLPTVFLPGTTYGMFVTNYAIVLRTSGDALALLPEVRREIEAMSAAVPITTVQTLDQIKTASMQQLSFAMVLLLTAGLAALLLGIVGIYGIVAYVVSQRTREIGIRIALGARTRDVKRMVLRQGGAVGAIGVGLGLVGAWGITRVLDSLLFEVARTDIATYGSTSLVLLGLVLCASLIPARRAASVDPVNALRAE